MNGISFRNVWVSLVVMVPVAAVGLFLLRNDPEAKSWFAFGLLIGVIALRHFLDRHELREFEGEDSPR